MPKKDALEDLIIQAEDEGIRDFFNAECRSEYAMYPAGSFGHRAWLRGWMHAFDIETMRIRKEAGLLKVEARSGWKVH